MAFASAPIGICCDRSHAGEQAKNGTRQHQEAGEA
jgi:hypothetical protein